MTSVLAMLTFTDAGRAIGHELKPADAAALTVNDHAVVRGDGVFETIGFVHGVPQSLQAHLDRFARSARMLELPQQDAEPWRAAIAEVGERLHEHPEAWARVVLSRGLDGRTPSGWVLGAPSPDHSAARLDGVAVVLLDRGLRSDVASASPWLLAGAKTLSYAANMAAQREAHRRGADDAIFVSLDGLLLEGTTSSLVLLLDGRLVTPAPELGILEGTSQVAVFEWAAEQGIATARLALDVRALHRADAAWLLSSIRLAAPIRAIDGLARTIDVELTTRMNQALLARRE